MKLDVVQLAYHVADIRRAALAMVDRFGAGPFFLNEHIRLAWGEHRGQPTRFVHSSAYGQWGEVMVELFRQVDDEPSPYRDMFAPDEEDLHHVAIMVDDLDAAFAHFERSGMPVVTRCGLRGADLVDFAFVDARGALGHMIELYPASAPLRAFYDRVRTAANGWDGREPLRPV
ncbi:MAG: VOC family protein [Pseudomonadales bacterium]